MALLQMLMVGVTEQAQGEDTVLVGEGGADKVAAMEMATALVEQVKLYSLNICKPN